MAQLSDVRLGSTKVDKIYCGTNLVYEKAPVDTTAPTTAIRPWDAIGNPTNTYDSAQTIYFDCNEMADTYYTLDGSTPTVNSTHYEGGGISVSTTTTIKYFSVDVAGNIETPKTTVYTISVAQPPVTTISPSSTTQNSIPITVTLSVDEVGATIYYKIGTSPNAQTYTAPFAVNQNSAYVGSTNIKITYWSVGANGTEAERSITYNTSSSIPGQPVLTATAGTNQVSLSWTSTINTTSYTVYRSTVSGQAGTILTGTQYMPETSWTDTTAVGGATYYYMIQAGNFGQANNSVQKSATPTGAGGKTWRYVRYVGHGDQTSTTSRLVEIQALEGATNRLLNKLPNAGYPVPNGGAIAVATNGAKLQSSGYPFWWTGEGVPDMYYDMGAEYPIDTINLTGYSTAGDPRQVQFKLYVSNNASTWSQVIDYSLNTTSQPVDGFYFDVPQS